MEYDKKKKKSPCIEFIILLFCGFSTIINLAQWYLDDSALL